MKASRALLSLFCLAGCAEAPPPYHAATDMKQFMNWVLDPAADVIWASAGVVSTLEGEHDLTPTTEEGWAAVRNAAATLAETGNLLMMPGRARDAANWMTHSRGLIDLGTQTIAAAEAKDGEAIFRLGGEIYEVCTACHEQYAIPVQGAGPEA